MINIKRVFSTINTNNGAMTMSWYFHAREGKIGPFKSYGEALNIMHHFIQKAIGSGDRGGRSKSEIPIQYSLGDKNIWR
jgi:hypothetical protein